MKQVQSIEVFRKRKVKHIACFTLFLLGMIVFPIALHAQQLAFPGAEGFGRYTSGGRGGEVYEVTNLNDSGPGSFREGVEMAGPRNIIFRISGTIYLRSDLRIRNDDISIFGQTAPGAGISTQGHSVVIQADNVIIQYMRFRPGDLAPDDGIDAIWGRENKDIIIDHCSMSWSIDETGSFYDNENFTLQWSILSESLYDSQHSKGRHGYGGIWGGQGATFHHNLLSDHTSRNPRFNGSRYSGNPDAELVDFRNNVIYNWGSNSAYGGEGGSYNIVNNYYKAGPATGSNKDRIVQPYADNGDNNQPAGVYGRFYINGNYITASSEVTNDNWEGVDPKSSLTKEQLKAETAFEAAPITLENAEDAYLNVLEYAGAILPRRDTIDTRVIKEARTGTETYGGVYGSLRGIIDTQEEVGGWPELLSASPAQDSDNDGIPDEWETENSLDPEDPSDGKEINETGYTNLESYLHTLQEAVDFTPVPGSLALIYPVGITGASIHTEFNWNSAVYAEGYQFELRDGAGDFANVLFDSTVTDTLLDFSDDINILEGEETYFWRVRAVNSGGTGLWSDYSYFVTETATSNEMDSNMPGKITLDQNYPNPFNPTTTIRYGLPQSAHIDLRVYDMTGREVAKLVSGNQSAGFHSIQFDAEGVASGLYIYKLRGIPANGAGNLFTQTRKMTLIK